jgi:hypothetical protein
MSNLNHWNFAKTKTVKILYGPITGVIHRGEPNAISCDSLDVRLYRTGLKRKGWVCRKREKINGITKETWGER